MIQRIWYEKYRPKKLEELKLKPTVYQKIKQMIANPKTELGHLLFVGLPGSGKTTLAKIIINSVIRSHRDILELNGSGLGVADVEVIESFSRTPPIASPIKIIFIDEFDNASRDFYLNFRKVMESAAKHVSIIATANYIRKIPSPIQSRFQIFYFNSIPKEQVTEYIFKILDAEKVKYKKEDVLKLIDYYYPRIRDIIQLLQANTVNKELILSDQEIVDVNQQILSLFTQILSGNATKTTLNTLSSIVRKYQNMLDLKYIMDNLMEVADLDQKLIIADYAHKIENSIYPDIILIALAYSLYKEV